MADEPTPADLATRLEELNDAVEALREELRPRGPFGLPRPPTPREAARLTADYGIPAAVAGLEAAARSLELLQAALRAADPEREDLPGGAASAGGAVLDRLDEALADLEAALEGSEPPTPAARDLLAEARELNARVRETVDGAESVDPGPRDRPADGDAIEEELESIKRDLDADEDGDAEADDSDGRE